MAVLPSLNIFTMMKKYLAATPGMPSEATIYALDGQRVDIRVSGSSTLLRNVRVMGDPAALGVGDSVPLIWEDNKPIVLALTSDGSVAISASVVTDNLTIENSPIGVRVKPGSLQTWHMAFTPSLEGHTHQDTLQRAGWLISAEGTIFKGETLIRPTGQIALGSGDRNLILDSADSRYRLYSGSADPDLALFAVLVDGSIRATAGSIAGWDILEDRLSKNNVELDPAGWLRLGVDNSAVYITSTTDEAWDEDWALWIGAENPNDAPFRVNKSGDAWLTSATISVNLESDNYIPGQSGWHLDPAGWIEAQEGIFRGKIQTAVFESNAVSVVAGRTMISDGSDLITAVDPADLVLEVSGDVFAADDILLIQPSSSRSEYFRVTSAGTPVTGGFSYDVVRNISGSGAETFYKGETVVRLGSATYPDPAPMWGDPDYMWGTPAWGGPGFKALGGYLVLEGSRDVGPYISVTRRFGASYNQVADVVRIGRLKGFLGYEIDDYGFGIGDLNRWMMYTSRDGLSLQTAGGRTTINDYGIASERFGLYFADDAPGYTDGMVRFWVDQATKRVYANYKDGAAEETAVWLDFSEGGSIADNSDKVDSFHASATAGPNLLLALNYAGKLPASITGDADTVDGVHLAGLSIAGHTHDDRYFTESEADARFLNGAGDELTDDLSVPDGTAIVISDVGSLSGTGSEGLVQLRADSWLRFRIASEDILELGATAMLARAELRMLGGRDIVLYAADNETEMLRLDGLTGTVNNVDVGALGEEDGSDVVIHRGAQSIGWYLDRLATGAVLEPVVAAAVEEGSLDIVWNDVLVLLDGTVLTVLAGQETMTDDDTTYMVCDGTDTASFVLTHDPETEILLATIVAADGEIVSITAEASYRDLLKLAMDTALASPGMLGGYPIEGGSVSNDDVLQFNSSSEIWEHNAVAGGAGGDTFLTAQVFS